MTIRELEKIKKARREENAVRFGRSGKIKHEFMVCCSTGCASGKSRETHDLLAKLIKERKLKDYRVGYSGCFGLCSEGPIVIVYPQGTFYTHVRPEAAKEIFEATIKGDVVEKYLCKRDDGKYAKVREEIEFFKRQNFVVRKDCDKISPDSIEDYISIDGYFALDKALNHMTPEQVIEEVAISGLRGRGGAGFPTANKWRYALAEKSPVKYMICNGDEGDPGAFMDRTIVERNPHSIIEAMVIAGYAINAHNGIVYIRAEYPLASEMLQKAINDARKHGLLGKNILGSHFDFDIIIKHGAGAFVCGEETALIHSVEGKRGEPTNRPPYPTTSGLNGKPTVINNVETLANIANIILHGGKEFAKIGTETSKGTKVFALSGNIKHTGLIELPMGTPLREIIYGIGGGIPNNREFKAVQMGGPSGGCIDAKNLDVPVDYDSLTKLGSMMGSGGMVVVDNETCMVNMAKFFLNFTCDESCGKCTPCRIGTKRMLEILDEISKGKGGRKKVEELEELCHYVKDTSLCGLGQTAPNPVLSTLENFKEEYIEHAEGKRCRAGVCEAFKNYEIDPGKCVGCSACSRVCPVGAISGEIRKTFKIDQKKCIKCGQCYKTCRFNAIHSGKEA